MLYSPHKYPPHLCKVYSSFKTGEWDEHEVTGQLLNFGSWPALSEGCLRQSDHEIAF
jgi:hypothetical protein